MFSRTIISLIEQNLQNARNKVYTLYLPCSRDPSIAVLESEDRKASARRKHNTEIMYTAVSSKVVGKSVRANAEWLYGLCQLQFLNGISRCFNAIE